MSKLFLATVHQPAVVRNYANPGNILLSFWASSFAFCS